MKRQLMILAVALLGVMPAAFAQKSESLRIMWPAEYFWKIGSNQTAGNAQMIELIPKNETLQTWTIMGTMLSMKGVRNVQMDAMMNTTYAKMKANAPNAKLTLIEKGTGAKYPWIMFKIESPGFKNSSKPESQLYFIVQGNQALYTNFVAIKSTSLTDFFIRKWGPVFKSSKIIQ